MKTKKVFLLVIFFFILIVMSFLIFAEDSKQASDFQSNGDLIEGWYWLRDSALQNYAEWTFDNIPLGPEEITVQINALATDRPGGGGGFDAKFLLDYSLKGEGAIPETLILPQTVTLKNVLSSDDTLGYNCQGQVTIPASNSPAGLRISLKISRDSVQDNHVAFKEDSIVLLTEAIYPPNGDPSPNDDDFEGALLIQVGTYTGNLGEEDEEGHRDNDDYYKIELEEGQQITLQLTIPGNAQYGISLLNPNHNSLGSSITQREIKTLDYVANSTGTWYIRVSRSSGEGDYQLAVNTSIDNDGEPGNNPPVISSLDASQNPVEV
nr:PPC domain-containing protein [Candidatus Atribacteria bacterium]